jgi:hypothetical protein
VRPPATTFGCGPLEVRVEAADVVLLAKVAETLGLYDVRWERPGRAVDLFVGWVTTPAVVGPGRFLTCARMTVDATVDGLRATTCGGAAAVGCFSGEGERWWVEVPADAAGTDRLDEVEDIVELVLTSGWRRAGWVPMHAAAVARDGTCALLCAPSGGGKSTLTAALVQRGWQALGDDKLLLRSGADRRPFLAAVLHTFNLDPCVRAWIPEVGDLERLPTYSAWTEKRKVRVADVWPEAVVSGASPTHLVVVRRTLRSDRVHVEQLAPAAVLDALLRQTVVPGDRGTAASVLQTVAATAQRLEGLRVHIPEGVFGDARALDAFEAALHGS